MQAEGIALVTGASRGIGRALALELARRGFDVIASMRDPAAGAPLAAQARREGLSLRVVRLDVTRPEAFDPPEGLRVLVNNAGLEGAQLPVEHCPAEQWREIFETNLFGLLELTRRAIPRLRAAGGGVVCNLGSASVLVPMPFFAAYRASKAAVSALGESLRAELAPFGIRILEILPGATDTDMLQRSDHVPEAAAFPEYRAMAARVDRARRGAAARLAPAAGVAAAIADAILDDAAPLRVAPDPMGAGLLDAWRKHDDEAGMRTMLALFTAGGPKEEA
jgi:NAD(P)-dependent dehydrogenase (short-subunit alcohol dehydrogenase family)